MVIILSILVLLILIFGLIEFRIHQNSLSKIPIRIHVNGSRGKSSVVRLIASGLRSGGIKTVAKTTGTSPRIIDEFGVDKYIHRLRSASIGEQISLIRHFSKIKPDALVIECMAVNPQYQWISEHKIVKSTIGVMTNVRPDHLDEMGISIDQITKSMSNTIPFNGILVTAEGKQSSILKSIASERMSEFYKTSVNNIDNKDISNFEYLEHKENISLALEVCKLCGVDKSIALKGMSKCTPDPGALTIWKMQFNKNVFEFINAFAANDPASTLKTWELVNERLNREKFAIFLNTRLDRQYRTIQLIDLIFKKLKPEILILRGENFPSELNDLSKKNKKIKIYKFPYSIKQSDLIKFFDESLSGYVILGVGNIVGWGETLMKQMKEYIID
tara:strand:+ start:4281 stop:5444 length:1164 start_codon:yes stop_codon:yes gene_type:complete